MKHTKIVCTIGPSSDTKTQLKKMIQAGMNVARLNFSHGTYKNHTQLIKTLRTAAKMQDEPIALLQDLQGPRIRTGNVPRDGIEIKKGEKVVLLSEREYKKYREDEHIAIPIQFAGLAKAVKPKGLVLVQDGTISMEVTSTRAKRVYCTVRQGGVVLSHKGINAPGADISGPVITKKDKQDLKFGIRQRVDYVALSFVKDASNIKQLRALLPKNSRIKIIAKIEREDAVKHFDDILQEADGIMVARGDLGVEIGPARVPILQKEMIMRCVRAGKPVIVATQMLESMTENPRPTRAEAADVANAIIDHTDALMLSAESATGAFPVHAIRTMTDIARQVEQSDYDDLPHEAIAHAKEGTPVAVAHASLHVAQSIGAKVVVVMTKTGDTARALAQLRPQHVKTVVATHDTVILRQMSLVWGVRSVLIQKAPDKKTFHRKIRIALKKRNIAKKGDEVVVITNFDRNQPGGVSEVITL
jgi:pyruvate kinase